MWHVLKKSWSKANLMWSITVNFTIFCYDMVCDFKDMLWYVYALLGDVYDMLWEIEMKDLMIWYGML